MLHSIVVMTDGRVSIFTKKFVNWSGLDLMDGITADRKFG